MYEDYIKILVYKLDAGEKTFKSAVDKAYLGCVFIPWKTCMEHVKDGESPSIPYTQALCRQPDDVIKYELQGELSGEIKWVSFGHPNSNYDADGNKRDRNAAAVDIPEQVPQKRTIDGVLKILPKEYTFYEDLPLSNNFSVEFKSYKSDNETELQSLTSTIMAERSKEDLQKVSWIEAVSFNIEDQRNDTNIHINVFDMTTN